MTELQGIVHDLPDDVYFGHDSLSSTGARRLLDSPARFRYEQDNPQAPRQAFDEGHAIHTLVLGTGSNIVELEFDNYRTKAAQEERDAVYAAGGVPMLVKDMAPIRATAEAVLAHPTARRLFEQDGTPETSLFAEIDGVACRARFDYYAPVAVDLKTTAGRADRHGFAQAAAKYGYEVQDAWYRDVREAVTGERGEFVFVVVEKDAPNLIGVHQLDRDFVDLGRAKTRRARAVYADCIESNQWPGYPEPIQLVVPPVWLVNDAIDKELA
ncbi:PD-(D/E)XK nuclease-like domain-containing protein [Agromyces sp. SYSU T00194]|uniref:PD-(D/E)XK nuclease-like domain-containing protein n=1 Tax=Agromyces chitinivorans TaxID=3158560 RepID=UPI003399E4FF